jgi:serine/threonine protein kinase
MDIQQNTKMEPAVNAVLAGVIAQGRAAGWVLGPDDVAMRKELGRGASGITYLGEVVARDGRAARPVAVKVYSERILAQDSNSVRNEVVIGAALKHPNIAEFVGLCVDPAASTVALVTAFLPKGELAKALYAGSSSSIRRKGDEVKFRIVIGTAQGLKYLHANNVIHRDIKPANILLDDAYNAYITDFGFSRRVDPDVHMTGQTGSFRYMAPEVVRSSDYSVKADVYSFAVIVNEIFTGEKPYQYYCAPDIAISVARDGTRPSQARVRNKRLRAIIARAWDQDPAARPDWPEVIAELESARLEMGVRRSIGIGALFGSRTSGSHSSADKSRLSTDAAAVEAVPGVAEGPATK